MVVAEFAGANAKFKIKKRGDGPGLGGHFFMIRDTLPQEGCARPFTS
jgi:hypothetical protein